MGLVKVTTPSLFFGATDIILMLERKLLKNKNYPIFSVNIIL